MTKRAPWWRRGISSAMVSNPPRVLHLINSHHRRGAEMFASQLAACSEERGLFKNGVCSLFNRGDDGLPLDGLTVFKLNEPEGLLNKIGLDPRLLARLFGVWRSFRPDVVVAHGGDTLKYASAMRCFYRKAATVYRNIGVASSWANTGAKIGLNKLFLKKVDAVVSVSQYTKRDFVDLYRFPRERVECIPNGVDAAQFGEVDPELARAEVLRELDLTPDCVLLIVLGNLSEEKGHQGLLRLIPGLRARGIDLHLLVAGEGPLRQDLERQAGDLSIARQTHFLGRRQDAPRLLAASDALVLPSRTEGMPAVLIEAGFAGLPAAAFDVGGVSEVVINGETGLVAPPGDFERLSKDLARLCLDGPLRREMGRSARLRCRDRFDMRQVTSKYEELFLSMTGSKDGRVTW